MVNLEGTAKERGENDSRRGGKTIFMKKWTIKYGYSNTKLKMKEKKKNGATITYLGATITYHNLRGRKK